MAEKEYFCYKKRSNTTTALSFYEQNTGKQRVRSKSVQQEMAKNTQPDAYQLMFLQ